MRVADGNKFCMRCTPVVDEWTRGELEAAIEYQEDQIAILQGTIGETILDTPPGARELIAWYDDSIRLRERLVKALEELLFIVETGRTDLVDPRVCVNDLPAIPERDLSWAERCPAWGFRAAATGGRLRQAVRALRKAA